MADPTPVWTEDVPGEWKVTGRSDMRPEIKRLYAQGYQAYIDGRPRAAMSEDHPGTWAVAERNAWGLGWQWAEWAVKAACKTAEAEAMRRLRSGDLDRAAVRAFLAAVDPEDVARMLADHGYGWEVQGSVACESGELLDGVESIPSHQARAVLARLIEEAERG